MSKRILSLASLLLIIFGVGVLFSSSVPPNETEGPNDLGSDRRINSESYYPDLYDQSNSNVPTSESVSDSDFVLVTKVIDGDTIGIKGGRRVRYIGIDTPETVDPRKSVQCFGREASARNKGLVEGKKIRLEKDISETDKYGRLLRYIWIGENLVNEVLVKEGYAYASSFPPDIKYQDRLNEAQKFAQNNNRGLWAVCEVAGVQTSQSQTQASQCDIKGNISSSGGKIYHTPGQRYYNKTVIDEARGEKWFCSEKEAKDAGWRKSKV